MRPSIEFVTPDWPVPSRVKALTTTREGGFSTGDFACGNLARHVEDDIYAVLANRARLLEQLNLPSLPCWLEQVHGNRVVAASLSQRGQRADASVAFHAQQVAVVMTADCLPVFFCDRQGSRVGLAHAGWRGLLAGVLDNTARALAVPSSEILVYLGPAIGTSAFEVGDEVRQAFVAQHPENALYFHAKGDKWLADLKGLARARLLRMGVKSIYSSKDCTFEQSSKYYSFRRDGQTGRMASLIWLQR